MKTKRSYFRFLLLFFIVAVEGSYAQPYVSKVDVSLKYLGKQKIDIAPNLELTTVSLKQANSLFQKIKSQKDIPFDIIENGCFAKANEVALYLDSQKINSAKIFATGDLQVETKKMPMGFVRWHYHVATTINVSKANGSSELYVIDPAMMSGPVTMKEWLEIQTKHSDRRLDEVFVTSKYHTLPWDRNDKLTGYQKERIRYCKRQIEKLKKTKAMENRQIKLRNSH